MNNPGCRVLSRSTVFQNTRDLLFRGLILILNHWKVVTCLLGVPLAAPAIFKYLFFLNEILNCIGKHLYPARHSTRGLQPVNCYLCSGLSTHTIFSEFADTMAFLHLEIRRAYELQWEVNCTTDPLLVKSIVLALLELKYFVAQTIVRTTEISDQSITENIEATYQEIRVEVTVWKLYGIPLHHYLDVVLQEIVDLGFQVRPVEATRL